MENDQPGVFAGFYRCGIWLGLFRNSFSTLGLIFGTRYEFMTYSRSDYRKCNICFPFNIRIHYTYQAQLFSCWITSRQSWLKDAKFKFNWIALSCYFVKKTIIFACLLSILSRFFPLHFSQTCMNHNRIKFRVFFINVEYRICFSLRVESWHQDMIIAH